MIISRGIEGLFNGFADSLSLMGGDGETCVMIGNPSGPSTYYDEFMRSESSDESLMVFKADWIDGVEIA